MDSNDSSRISLRILGLSYKEIQKGAYALILAETDGPHYIPIVIGTNEAQSIAMKLENFTPPRPITHDIFASFAHAFGIQLKEVFIHKFEDGIFWSELVFVNRDGDEVVLDARTSDAIAIALRTHSPIYTTPEIVEETGFIMEQQPPSAPVVDDDIDIESIAATDELSDEAPLDDLSAEQLQSMLADLIAEERYEEAARVSEALKRKPKP